MCMGFFRVKSLWPLPVPLTTCSLTPAGYETLPIPKYTQKTLVLYYFDWLVQSHITGPLFQPNFGHCHMSHWPCVHVTTSSKNYLVLQHVGYYSLFGYDIFHGQILFKVVANSHCHRSRYKWPNVKILPLCHRSHPWTNQLKWNSTTVADKQSQLIWYLENGSFGEESDGGFRFRDLENIQKLTCY